MKFTLQYPITPFQIIQPFGSDPAYYSKFGLNGHNGIDLEASHGTPVYAAHDGEAYFETDPNGGEGIVIRTTETFDYESSQVYFKSIYWHLCDGKKEPQFASPIMCTDITRPGQLIKTGDLIGYSDNTGFPNESTGEHLHFGLKPMAMTGEYPGQFANYAQTNGFLGAIDPTPYFNTPVEAPTMPYKHAFYIPMKYGDEGSEVLALQRCLQSIGFFPKEQICTGYYGDVTEKAVFLFDRKYAITGVSSFIAVWADMGVHAGPITIAALNRIFA